MLSNDVSAETLVLLMPHINNFVERTDFINTVRCYLKTRRDHELEIIFSTKYIEIKYLPNYFAYYTGDRDIITLILNYYPDNSDKLWIAYQQRDDKTLFRLIYESENNQYDLVSLLNEACRSQRLNILELLLTKTLASYYIRNDNIVYLPIASQTEIHELIFQHNIPITGYWHDGHIIAICKNNSTILFKHLLTTNHDPQYLLNMACKHKNFSLIDIVLEFPKCNGSQQFKGFRHDYRQDVTRIFNNNMCIIVALKTGDHEIINYIINHDKIILDE